MDQKQRAKLQSDFPELVIHEVKELGEGWDNVAYLINGDTVFRMPKQKAAGIGEQILEHTKTEIRFLKAIEGRLPVKTPHIQYAANDESYYGYNFAKGVQVTYDTIRDHEAFVELWVDTMLAINNSITRDDAQGMGVKSVSLNQYRLRRVNEVAESALLPRDLHELALNTLEQYLTTWEQAPQYILHGDPGLGNWIFDEVSGGYTLIDWSDICIGPQEFQLYRLINDMPEYLEFACAYYAQQTGLEINKKLLFLCGNASILSMLGAFIEREGFQSVRAQEKVEQLRFWAALQADLL